MGNHKKSPSHVALKKFLPLPKEYKNINTFMKGRVAWDGFSDFSVPSDLKESIWNFFCISPIINKKYLELFCILPFIHKKHLELFFACCLLLTEVKHKFSSFGAFGEGANFHSVASPIPLLPRFSSANVPLFIPHSCRILYRRRGKRLTRSG